MAPTLRYRGHEEKGGAMKKKKSGKSKAAKSMRTLPAKTVSARNAKTVKGGGSTKGTLPNENISFNFGKPHIEY
jgi:hypothetical protein